MVQPLALGYKNTWGAIMRVLNCIKDYHKNKINNESNKHFSDLKYIYIPGIFFSSWWLITEMILQI